MASRETVAGRPVSERAATPDAPIVIVGAGEAGVAAAAALREGGYQGSCIIIGKETLVPYERPPLSKEMLIGEQPAPRPIRPADWYQQADIDLRLGTEVIAIDPETRELTCLCDGTQTVQPYRDLVLTTGARVRRLAGHAENLFYLRDFGDAERLHSALQKAQSVAIVGGGVIGLEVAASARKLGKQVVVIDPAARLMARALAPEVSEILRALHDAAGIELILGGEAPAVRTDGNHVRIEQNGITRTFDVCVVGIGVLPNTQLAEMAGCLVEDGVVVDGCGRTSVAHIYAAGDVAAFSHPLFGRPVRIESWQHAGRHGAHVARALIGMNDDYCEIPWFWTDQLDHNIQVAGLAAECDFTVWRGETPARTAFHFLAGRLVAATTIDNGRDMRPSLRLLAASWASDPALLTDMTRPLGQIATALLTPQATKPAAATA